MNRKEVENMINNINEKYVQEAGEYVLRNGKTTYRNRIIKHVGIIAAVFAVCFIVSVPALSVAGVQPACDVLYSVFPEVAQKLKPVNLSCEDNGIKMEVVSANVHDNVADIYISLQDITSDRIDENIDLFDSYYIKPAFDVGRCELVDYNPTTKMATFLTQLSQFNNQKISGEKITFGLSKFLSGKQEYNEALSDIILKNVKKNPVTQSDVNIRGCSGGVGVDSNAELIEGIKKYLKEDEKNNYSPIEGVRITAAGFIDEKLHIQVYYEDILKTDNHGELYLTDSKNNIINYKYSEAFWDETESGSYEEYVFDILPETNLDNYVLYGNFVVSSSLTEGDWQVTFPLENMK